MAGHMGRPLKLTTLIDAPTTEDDHRRITIAAAICEEMEATGLRAELCCRAVGVTRKTIESWMAEGARACEKHDKGTEALDTKERQLRDFLLNTRVAHARFIRARLDLHHDVAKGGLVMGYVVEEVDPATLVTGEDGRQRPKVTKRTVRQERSLPNPKALEWELERLGRDEDGDRIFAPRVEVTGADGGPVEVVDHEERARALAAEAEAFVRGIEDGAARAAESEDAAVPASSNGAGS